MKRRGNASIVANPVLVGAVTTLVVVVAVFLAYNANNGLPFVPTRQVKVQIDNGANLVRGNEVRSGGFRVGIVEKMEAVRLPSGVVGAELTLKLDDKLGPLPVDSTVKIRPRSALGLKYVEVNRGSSKRVLDDGGSLPASQASVPVDIDEVYDTFDLPTREAAQRNLEGFGDAFTGRGGDLSDTIRGAPSLFGHLARVARNLSDERTALASFFGELDDAARIVAPVSETQARLFTTMGTTFDAISRDPDKLQETIEKSPPTLDVVTASLRVQRPFLVRTAAFSRDLQGAARELRGALPTLNRALAVGVPVTKRSPALYRELEPTFESLRKLAVAPTTNGALRGLTATASSLQPQLRFLGPYVTVCNSWNQFWTFLAEHVSSPDLTGSVQRVLLNTTPPTNPEDPKDSVGAQGANEFAHGQTSPEPGVPEQQLHAQFHGDAVTEDGKANCETGQQGFVASANPFRDRSIPGDPYKRVAVDHPKAFEPGQGPTRLGPSWLLFNREGRGVSLNPDQVPTGQTFTVRPGGLARDTPPKSVIQAAPR